LSSSQRRELKKIKFPEQHTKEGAAINKFPEQHTKEGAAKNKFPEQHKKEGAAKK
jgi:hypothetical protein